MVFKWAKQPFRRTVVVDQVMKESSYKSPLMVAYYQEVRKLEDKFQGIRLHHVP